MYTCYVIYVYLLCTHAYSINAVRIAYILFIYTRVYKVVCFASALSCIQYVLHTQSATLLATLLCNWKKQNHWISFFARGVVAAWWCIFQILVGWRQQQRLIRVECECTRNKKKKKKTFCIKVYVGVYSVCVQNVKLVEKLSLPFYN